MRWLYLTAALAAPLFAQLPAPNDAGVSLGHLHFLVNEPNMQVKLWTSVLGAEVTHSGTLEVLRLPGIYVLVGKAGAEPNGGMDGSTVNHVGFLVKDFADVKAKLAAANVETSPVTGNPKQIMAKFPEGITVELTDDPSLAVPVSMHHIHLSTPNPEKQRDWYVKTLGARAGMRGNFQAAFIPGGELDMRKAQKPDLPTKGRTLDHIGFEVKDLEAFCKKLEADGIKLDMPYRDRPQIALKIAFLTDPEGTRIELTEGLAGK